LKELLEIGWIEELHYTAVKKYRINQEKKALKHLIALFKETGYI